LQLLQQPQPIVSWPLSHHAPEHGTPLRAPGRLAGAAFVACAHFAIGWAIWALGAMPLVAAELRPLMVALIAPQEPEPAPAPPRQTLPLPQPLRLPELPLVPPPPLPAPENPTAITVQPAPAPEPVLTPTPAPVLTPPPAPAPAPPPPARPLLDARAVRYLTEPPAEVPRASRRAGEHGTVWLRVVVDVNGQPAQVRLHRSSGYARLDEQALWAMRQARFRPHTVDGRAVEVEVIAPIEYPAE
jgi:protein TonB